MNGHDSMTDTKHKTKRIHRRSTALERPVKLLEGLCMTNMITSREHNDAVTYLPAVLSLSTGWYRVCEIMVSHIGKTR